MFFGWCLGLSMGILLVISLVEVSPTWLNKNEVIVYKINNGIVCKEDKSYPKLNCLLIKEAIGPKKDNWKFKIEEK